MRHGVRWLVFVGSFRLRHSFVIRHWSFVIDFYQTLASEHATAVVACASRTAILDTRSVMQNSSTWETCIPNRLGDLMRAIEALGRCLEQWGADPNACYLAQLAVEELGTNIIKYGYDDQSEHTIRLSAACEESVFRFCLEDDGHEFNPCLT